MLHDCYSPPERVAADLASCHGVVGRGDGIKTRFGVWPCAPLSLACRCTDNLAQFFDAKVRVDNEQRLFTLIVASWGLYSLAKTSVQHSLALAVIERRNIWENRKGDFVVPTKKEKRTKDHHTFGE